MKTGLTSITFRNKSIEEIAALVKGAHLSAIEWGGDVHCPPDNHESALFAREETEKNGLSVSSYGSYFNLSVNDPPEFESICKTAATLKTDTVRIWAYDKDHDQVTEAEYEKCVSDARILSDIAQKYGMAVCFEYHRGTLTRSAAFAKKLIEDIDRKNIRLYWQPNPEISHDANCKELSHILPYVVNIHCFHWVWNRTNERHPLKCGNEEWKDYIEIAKKGTVKHVLLEFVCDDSDRQFFEDAKTLEMLLN